METVDLLRDIVARLTSLQERVDKMINRSESLSWRRQQSLENCRRQYYRQHGISDDNDLTNSALKRTDTPEGVDEVDGMID